MHQVVVGTSASHTRYGIAAIAMCSAALWVVGDARASEASSPESATDRLPASGPETGGYVEEVIVTADRLEKGEMPSQTIIVQTYNVLQRGKRLYNERRYKEALPYLLIASKRGFKWAQAMAGDIYVHGRGGVPRDIEEGMGWLGVAARPQTAPRIQTYFRRALAEMSPQQKERVRGGGSSPSRGVEQPGLAGVVSANGLGIADGHGCHEPALEQEDALHLHGRDTGVPRAAARLR